jgi:hypothetical protein
VSYFYIDRREKIMCKKNCLSCHFFYFYQPHATFGGEIKELKRSFTQKERDKIIEDPDYGFYYLKTKITDTENRLKCFKNVWDEYKLIAEISKKKDYSSLNKEEENLLKEKFRRIIIEQDRSANNPRGNSCFYFEFQKEMLLPAAEELEKRLAEQKEASADRKWIKWGVWTTFLTVLATIVAALIPEYLHINTGGINAAPTQSSVAYQKQRE